MVVLCSAMKAVQRQKSHPKKIEVGHCYLAMESTNVSLVLYRVCVVAAIATASEQYEVPYIYDLHMVGVMVTYHHGRFTSLTMVAMQKLTHTIC